MSKLTYRDYLELIKLLRLDVFFILSIIGSGMPTVTINQLAQDKFCLNSLKVNETICLSLENVGDEFSWVREKVLSKTTTIKMYTTIITTIPSVLTSLFLGYWIDTYPGHIRFLLILGPLSVIFQNFLLIQQSFAFETDPMSLLYTYVAPALTSSLVMTGAFTYATRKTPAKYRAVRFMVMEVFIIAGMPISTTLGGVFLGEKPWFSNQLRNYIGVFIVSSIFSAIASIWCLIMIKDNANGLDQESNQNDNNNEKTEEITNISDQRGSNAHDKAGKSSKEKSFTQMALDIFKIRNLKSTLHTAIRPRDNNQRAALLTIMVSMVICNIGYQGEIAIGQQYALQVYRWSAEHYSYMSSVIILIPAVVVLSTPALIIHKFNQHDSVLGVLGSVSLAVALLMKGLFLFEAFYFISTLFGSFTGLLPIANRSILSRMILGNEIGQIFSLLSSIEPTGPLLSSILYSNIFNATIDTYPGTVYLIIGTICTFPAFVTIWLFLTKQQWDLVLIAESKKNLSSRKSNDNVNHENTLIRESNVSYSSNEVTIDI